jgi:predicted pyridoxine 5'-phosphate oxidase superfamily flavin-nucleotide-binding protein
MAFSFGSLIFTDAIKTLQEKYGSRAQYARRETSGLAAEPIGPSEAEFIGERDSFYIATVGEGGWPYVQHRGGFKGFVKIPDDHTIAFADFRGNKQYITTGNLMTDDRVALIFVDYPRRTRLKIVGHTQVFEGTDAEPWLAKFGNKKRDGVVERVFVIRVKATDWNCPQHITPRFTEDEIREALAPWEQRFEALRKENEELRRQLQLAAMTDKLGAKSC